VLCYFYISGCQNCKKWGRIVSIFCVVSVFNIIFIAIYNRGNLACWPLVKTIFILSVKTKRKENQKETKKRGNPSEVGIDLNIPH
jgi:hypothetical protein